MNRALNELNNLLPEISKNEIKKVAITKSDESNPVMTIHILLS